MNVSEFEKKVSSSIFEHPDNFWVGGGVSKEFIIKIECSLGFSLNNDYKDFLKEFGCVGFDSDFYFGLNESQKYSYANLDLVTKEFKEKTGLELKKKTLLQNEDDEFYLFVDNENGKVISYDPFSKTFDEVGENIFSYLSGEFDDMF